MDLGTLTVNIGAKTNQLDKGLRDAQRKMKRFSSKMRRIGQTMTAAITAPMAGIAAMSIKMASDFEETSNKFDVAFGDMAEESRKMADQLAEDMQRSRLQMRNFAADSQAMLSSMLGNREAAAEMSMALTALSTDIGSFFNIQDTKALERMTSGLVGETEAVRRLGVDLSQTTLETKALKMGIVSNYKELTESQKVYLRFITILEQTKDAQGDAIRTSDSLENQWKALKAEVQDLGIMIGKDLMPYALGLVSWAKNMTGALKDLSPEVRASMLKFSALAAAIGPVTIGISMMLSVLPSLISGIQLTSKALKSLIIFMNANPYIALATVFAGLALSIDEVQEGLGDLMDSMGLGFISDAAKGFGDLSEEIKNFDPESAQKKSMERLKKMYSKTLSDLKKQLKNGLDNASGIAKSGGENIVNSFHEAFRSTKFNFPAKQLTKKQMKNITSSLKKLKQTKSKFKISYQMESDVGIDTNELKLQQRLLREQKSLMETFIQNGMKGSKAYDQLANSIGKTQDRIKELSIKDAQEDLSKSMKKIAAQSDIANALGESFNETEAQIRAVKRTIMNLIKLDGVDMGSVKVIKLMERLKDLSDDVKNEFKSLEQIFKEFKDSMVRGLSDAIARGESLSDTFDRLLDQLASQILQNLVIGPMVNSISGSLNLPIAHSGGMVKKSGIKKFHDGGMVGRPDEQLALLQTGEAVLSRQMVRNAGKSNPTGGTTIINNINAIDTQTFAQALNNNKASVTRIVGDNIQKNGELREVLKQNS